MDFKSKYLSKKDTPYFISEIGINHNGLLGMAIKMIWESKKSGFDAVKFQKRDAEDLLNFNIKPPSAIGYLSKNINDIPKSKTKFGGWTYPDIRLELNKTDYIKIKKFCKKIKIDLIVTPWDEKSVDFLKKLGIKCFKVASIDANNFHFCEYVAKQKVPTIVSTGMCTMEEIKKTKKIFNNNKCPVMFMHCTSAYPSRDEDKNLSAIPFMKKILKTDIGFSGHGTGFTGTVGAIALGSPVIEKHSTLSTKMSGPDHAASLEFEKLKELIDIGRGVKRALGNPIKKKHKSEEILHRILCRKFVVRKNIKKGSKLSKTNIKTAITYKKGGITPNQYYRILNKKVFKDLKKGHILSLKDFK